MDIQKELDQIIDLQNRKSQEIKRIRRAEYQSMGMIQYPLDPAKKETMIKAVSDRYDQKIKQKYTAINTERIRRGQNPF